MMRRFVLGIAVSAIFGSLGAAESSESKVAQFNHPVTRLACDWVIADRWLRPLRSYSRAPKAAVTGVRSIHINRRPAIVVGIAY
jgi:hypothetical protein